MRLSATVLAITLLASACTSAGGTPAPTDTTATTEVREPLDLNDLAEVLFIDEAEHFRIERAIYDCMEEAGFRYNISPYWPYDMFEAADWRLVVHPPPVVEHDQAEEDAYRELRRDISRAQVGWEDAFFGTEREYLDLGSGGGMERFVGGCFSQGQAIAVGDPSAWHELLGRVQGIQGEAYAEAEATSAASSANDAWVSCMRARGFNASSPEDFDSESVEAPGPQEAFRECMDESRFDTVVGEEQASVVGALLQQNVDTLGPLLAILTEQPQP